MSLNVSRFLSILQTKANWQVRLINFGGMSPSRGALVLAVRRGTSRSKGGCPREMPISFCGTRARWARHFPGAEGQGQSLWGFWVPGIRSQIRQAREIKQCCRPSLRACRGGQDGGGHLWPARAGPSLEPKVRSQSLRLAGSCSASTSPRSRACLCDLGVPLPKNMPQGDGAGSFRGASSLGGEAPLE